MILKYVAMGILSIATLRQAIRCSVFRDNPKEDDKFIYIFGVTVIFFLMFMEVI